MLSSHLPGLERPACAPKAAHVFLLASKAHFLRACLILLFELPSPVRSAVAAAPGARAVDPHLVNLIVGAGAQVLQRLARARERQRVSTGGAAGPDDSMGPDFGGGGGGDSDESGDEEVTAGPGNPARRSTGAAVATAPGLSGVGDRGL